MWEKDRELQLRERAIRVERPCDVGVLRDKDLRSTLTEELLECMSSRDV